ncbi:MAG: thermonuclease family protein [Patescibacteria group bacterium]
MLSRKFLYIYILLFASLFVFGGFFTGNLNKNRVNLSSITNREGPYKTVWVIDGDTIKVLINNKEETIRLIGIDTPEVVDPRKPVQCFGIEASNKAKEILQSRMVLLEPDAASGDVDQYHRLLRYVFLEDGTNFNKLMIEKGYAHEYTYKDNQYKYRNEFIEKEKEARENKRGLWADNACLYNK